MIVDSMRRETIERKIKGVKDEMLDKKTSLFDLEGLYSEMEMSLQHLEDEEKEQIERQMKELKTEMNKLSKRLDRLSNLVYKYDLELYNKDLEKNKEIPFYNN